LEELRIHLHHLESDDCLSAFTRVKKLKIIVSEEGVARSDLFTHLKSKVINQVELAILVHCPHWALWITQLKSHDTLRDLQCIQAFSEIYFISVPEYLKSLPPGLTSLHIPHPSLPFEKQEATSVLSNSQFIECLHHFPSNLTSLSFELPFMEARRSLWLSDDCFTHLPSSLTELDLSETVGLTERFWDIIPPYIGTLTLGSSVTTPTTSFCEKKYAYQAKFERF
jgi:hypothetical protein